MALLESRSVCTARKHPQGSPIHQRQSRGRRRRQAPCEGGAGGGLRWTISAGTGMGRSPQNHLYFSSLHISLVCCRQRLVLDLHAPGSVEFVDLSISKFWHIYTTQLMTLFTKPFISKPLSNVRPAKIIFSAAYKMRPKFDELDR